MAKQVVIEPGSTPLSLWRLIFRERSEIALADGVKQTVEACQQTVAEMLQGDRPIYGVNTGFGKLAHIRIDESQARALQFNLIMSHSAGTGPLLDDDLVRLVMILKVSALAQGHSGVRWQVTPVC